MQGMTPWLDRQFDYQPAAGEYPMIVERLRDTPARIQERVLYRRAEQLTRRDGDAWSAQEHVGHLLDLEALWATRTWEFLAGAANLTAADMSNRKTHEAGHNQRALTQLLAEFHVARGRLVATLEGAADTDVVRTAHHPRLKRSMRLVDLCFFVAEHDDHHLTHITRLLP